MQLESYLTHPGAQRAHPGLPPSRERVEDLARAVAAGRYRVSPEAVAAAMLRAARGRSAPPG